jgi:hypothetical protein
MESAAIASMIKAVARLFDRTYCINAKPEPSSAWRTIDCADYAFVYKIDGEQLFNPNANDPALRAGSLCTKRSNNNNRGFSGFLKLGVG